MSFVGVHISHPHADEASKLKPIYEVNSLGISVFIGNYRVSCGVVFLVVSSIV